MFAGFDPRLAAAPYLERRRGPALAIALLLHALLVAAIIWIEMSRGPNDLVEVVLDDAEVANLEIEEEAEEPEPEPEPPPPPEPAPKPKSRDIENVTKMTEKLVESEVAPERAPEEEPETRSEEPGPETPKAPTPEPEAPRKKKIDVGDRETARPMPADGTPPRPERSNKAPEYPEKLRVQNITGVVKVKLDIHMDGTVRGMKVLQKSVGGTDDPQRQEEAKKLFLKSVVTAVKTWTFTPAKLKGKTISVWWPVSIPFNLN